MNETLSQINTIFKIIQTRKILKDEEISFKEWEEYKKDTLNLINIRELLEKQLK